MSAMSVTIKRIFTHPECLQSLVTLPTWCLANLRLAPAALSTGSGVQSTDVRYPTCYMRSPPVYLRLAPAALSTGCLKPVKQSSGIRNQGMGSWSTNRTTLCFSCVLQVKLGPRHELDMRATASPGTCIFCCASSRILYSMCVLNKNNRTCPNYRSYGWPQHPELEGF